MLKMQMNDLLFWALYVIGLV